MNQHTEETCQRFIERRARGWPLERITGLSSPVSPSFPVPPPNFKFHPPVKFGEICPPRNSVARPPTLGQNQNPSAANPRWPNHLPGCSAAAGAVTPPLNRRAGKFKFHQTGWGEGMKPLFLWINMLLAPSHGEICPDRSLPNFKISSLCFFYDRPRMLSCPSAFIRVHLRFLGVRR